MKVRDARPEEVSGATARGSRNPERDAMIDQAIDKASKGRPQVVEVGAQEKNATLRVAVNKRIKLSGKAVRVRALGKDRLLVEARP